MIVNANPWSGILDISITHVHNKMDLQLCCTWPEVAKKVGWTSAVRSKYHVPLKMHLSRF